jgi:hypothetical protein
MAGINTRLLRCAEGGLQAEICSGFGQEFVYRLEADRALSPLSAKTGGVTRERHRSGESGNDRKCRKFERIHGFCFHLNCFAGRCTSVPTRQRRQSLQAASA